jgi:hypothetical protein
MCSRLNKSPKKKRKNKSPKRRGKGNKSPKREGKIKVLRKKREIIVQRKLEKVNELNEKKVIPKTTM